MITRIILTIILAGWFSMLGIGKILGTESMAERAEHMGMSLNAYRIIGALEVAGVIGLVAGWAMTPFAICAAIGFLLLLAGAIRAHLRVGDRLADIAPAIFSAALVAVYLVVLP